MPGNVGTASPVGVMPQTLCLSFSESRVFEEQDNTYHDGERQVGQLAQTSRRTFKLSSKLTSSQLTTLKTFWDSVEGGLTPFLFYNFFEGTPVGSNYDPTGGNTTGRYTMVFRGNWSQSTEMQRTTVPNLELVEVA